MKKNVIILVYLCLALVSYAQIPKTDSRHENHYQYIAPIVTDEVKIEIYDAHSQMNFAQFKIRITNKTNDFITLKTDEILFHIEDREYRLREKEYIIKPRDYISRTIRVDGDYRFHVEEMMVEFNGFYRIPVDGTVKNAGTFNLPNSVNYIEFDSFQCKVSGRIIQETKITELPLRCTYVGNKVGMIEASRISVKLENGMEFANVNIGSKIKNLTSTGSTDVLFPGENAKITAIFRIPASTADMQFSNLIVYFNDTFSETELLPIGMPSQNFILDKEKTIYENR